MEYWARIGSEDNMTMCHRPTCRKEGVLLDYSVDGGEEKSHKPHYTVIHVNPFHEISLYVNKSRENMWNLRRICTS